MRVNAPSYFKHILSRIQRWGRKIQASQENEEHLYKSPHTPKCSTSLNEHKQTVVINKKHTGTIAVQYQDPIVSGSNYNSIGLALPEVDS